MLLASGPQPQVIVIVEAWQTLFNVYIDELQRQTGRTWYGAFGTHCAAGTWNGSGCASWYQGVGIFSIYPITSSSSTLFPYADCWTAARVGVRAAINVNGTHGSGVRHAPADGRMHERRAVALQLDA